MRPVRRRGRIGTVVPVVVLELDARPAKGIADLYARRIPQVIRDGGVVVVISRLAIITTRAVIVVIGPSHAALDPDIGSLGRIGPCRPQQRKLP